MSIRKRRRGAAPPVEAVAGNGLLDRRALLGRGILFAGAMTAGTSLTGAAAEPLKDDPWSLEMGAVTPPLQVPSRFEKNVVRTLSNPKNEFRNSHARTPHHLLNGTVTPNSLHFSINHSGLPDIDPAKHRLVDPRHGEAAARVLARDAVALSDGHAHGLRRMQRQQRADVLQRAVAGDRAGAARARVERRVDRRAALGPARRGRHRPEAPSGSSPRAATRSRSTAACRSRRPTTMR